MFLLRSGVIFLAFVVVFALSSGSILHAVIPHEHNHDDRKDAGVIWEQLHAAVRHEDKQTLLASADALPLFALGINIALGCLGAVFIPLYIRQKPFTTLLGALRSGIVAYRKFR